MSCLKYLAIFLLCSLVFAQDAVVVELKTTDATTAKTLYEAKIAADKAWDQFNGRLDKTYDFSFGVQFSKDFRFIVPKSYTPPPYYGGCFSGITPATGIFTDDGINHITVH